MTETQFRTVQVNGYSIAYREAGRGEVVILLHGFLCDSRCWCRQVKGLSDRFRVVAWDAPGAGSSSDPPETFTTSDYVHCLADFLDALGIERAHVVGLSWGGILAQEFYRRHPKRIDCLVLADTYAGWKGSLPEPVWTERVETCLRGSTEPPEALVAKLLPGMFTDAVSEFVRQELAAIMSEFHAVGFRVMSRSSAEVDTRDLLPAIDVPTLVLWGDDDRRSPRNVAEQLHGAIRESELVILPNAGHVSNMEQPEAFNSHVRRFCRDRGSADAASRRGLVQTMHRGEHMADRTLIGVCRCGAVTLEVCLTSEPQGYNPRVCDCDFCRKHGAAYISDPNGSVVIRTKSASNIQCAQQGNELAEFLFCSTCGQLLGARWRNHGNVNARVLSDKVKFGVEQPASPKKLSAEQKTSRWKELWFPKFEVSTSNS